MPTAAFGYCLQERRSCDLDPVFFPVGKRGWGEMEHPVMFQGVAKDSPAFRLMTQMVRSSVLDFRLPVCCFLCQKL